MGRGIFFGFIWGGLVAVLGLSVASVLGDGPSERAAEPVALQDPAPVARTDPAATAPAPEPMGVDQPQAPVADTRPAALPETGETLPAPAAPVVQDESAQSLTEEEPVLPSPQAMAPVVSSDDAVPDVAAQTPPEDAPVVAQEQTPQDQSAPAPDAQDTAPDVASDAPQAPPAPQADSAAVDDAQTPDPAQADVTPDAQPEGAPEDNADAATDDAMQAPATEDPAPEPRIALQSEQGNSVGQPVGTFGDRARNVETGRLPTITTDIAEDAPSEDTVPADSADTAQPDPDAPPLERFAAASENPENRPLMSILLIDDGSSPIGADALRSFPYPITFAVRAGAPDAAGMMAKYRDAGFEVLALVDLPAGAAPTDIEVALDASLGNVPEAAGVLIAQDVPGGRQGTEQLIERLGAAGYGLVTASSGLNATAQLAESTGFPAANIFDDMDSEGQTPTVIRRFLDNAAFRAAQGEEVIMMGRIRPDTISALLLWGLGDRAGRVALVPVSAVLTAP